MWSVSRVFGGDLFLAHQRRQRGVSTCARHCRIVAAANSIKAIQLELDGGTGEPGAELGVALGRLADGGFVDVEEFSGLALATAEADGDADVVFHLLANDFGSSGWHGRVLGLDFAGQEDGF
jgi:hypothetical protein